LNVLAALQGSECPFNHGGAALRPKKPQLCANYRAGLCASAHSCRYYHETWPCIRFHRDGACSNGDDCRYSHEQLTDETRPLVEKVLRPVKTKDDKKLKAENKTKAEEKMKDAKATKADVAEDTKATDRQTQQPKKKSLLGLLRFLLTTEHISLGIAISASMCLLACLKNHLSNK